MSFGTEIWVGIQSSRGAVLSRSDFEEVLHSKFHLTHTGRQALALKKARMEVEVSEKLVVKNKVF